MNEKKVVQEGLSADLMEKGAKTKILSAIGAMANCFGNIDGEIKSLVTESATASRNFIMLASLCGVYMGYTYMCETVYGRGHWDERNLACMGYSFSHLKEFTDIFENASGTKIRYVGGNEHRSFSDDLVIGETPYIPLIEELQDFYREHHTIQQKMMGIFIRILDEILPGSGLEEVSFPFI